jgi:mutator protein MutT
MRVSVASLAFKGERIFIAKRIPGGSQGGKWELPGGKAEVGEMLQAALARELYEELGVSALIGARLAHTTFTHKGVERLLVGYRVIFERESFSLTAHTDARWARPGEIARLSQAGAFTPSDFALLAALSAPGA